MRIRLLVTAFLLALVALPLRAQQTDLMMQAWYWDYFQGGNFGNWANVLNTKAAELQAAKFKHIWLPPLPRSSTPNNYSNGYNPKDLYDFGQYGSDCAWGSRSELNSLIANLNARGMKAVSDVVYNHRDGGRPERNDAVRTYVNAGSGAPYPSDRCFLILPLGSNNPGANGAGDYYLKIRSRAYGNAGVQYKIYARTNLTAYNPTVLYESEPNNGVGCGWEGGFDDLPLGQDLIGTFGDYSGCHADEYKITLTSGSYTATDDTLFIYISNPSSGYTDHIVEALWSAPRSQAIAGEIEYWTYSDFTGLASGQGGMNYNGFRPNDNTALSESLGGDWNWMWFFYDYDQSQPITQTVLNEWSKWQLESAGIDGLRMDAVKHFDPAFVGQLMNYLVANGALPDMVVGEYFDGNPFTLRNWVDAVQNSMNGTALSAIQVRVFDFAMREALKNACDQFGYDVRNVFNSGMVDAAGANGFEAVTFVNNHDFRSPGEPVQNDPMLAYAYLLTNNQIGAPCVFYPDFYGIPVPNAPTVMLKNQITTLMGIHEQYIYGSPDVEYLSRFSTPYYQFFSQGQASTSLVYQLYPPSGSSSNVIVAINFSGTPLDLYQGVRTDWGVAQGDWFVNLIGNSTGGSQNHQITYNASHPELHIQLPARSYAVYVQSETPLPLDLLDFAARAEGDAALLAWRTAREEAFDRFELERAIGSAVDFTTIATLPGRGDNTHEVAEYSFRDETLPANTDLYYRLKMIDRDGSFSYSPLRSLRFDRSRFEARVNPNPGGADSRLVIQNAHPQPIQLLILNALGQVIWQENVQLSEGENRLPLPTLERGVYQILLQGEGRAQVVRFVRL